MINEYIYLATATLLVVVDPVFTSAIFLGLITQMTLPQKREVALRTGSAGFCVLLGIVLAALAVHFIVDTVMTLW